MLGIAEGRLGIDHPIQSLELSEESIEGSRLLESIERAAKPSLFCDRLSWAAPGTPETSWRGFAGKKNRDGGCGSTE
jgi:hypothetical protein